MTAFPLIGVGVREDRNLQERALLALVALFLLVNAAALSLALEGALIWSHLWAPTAWFVLIGAAHMALSRFRPGRDPFLLPLYGLLTGWGLLLIDRLAPAFLWRQTLWLGLGTAALLLVAIVPRNLRLLRRYPYTWLALGILLLLATLVFGVNPSGFGPAHWLPVPFSDQFFFQPSELLRLLLVIFFASYFDEHERVSRLRIGEEGESHLVYLGPLLLMWGFSILLLVLQQDLGAATLFFLSFLALLYLATGRWQYTAAGALLLALAGVIGYFAFAVVERRVAAWWAPWPDVAGGAFQIVQSLYAIAAGGVIGQGIGQGFPGYIPFVHTDMMYAAIAEEWGLVGSISVVALFAILAYRGLRIASLSRRPFNVYLAAGITIFLTTQAILIMAGVSKLLPLTGITLPLVSYGGSSLLMSSLMIGLLLYLSTKQSSER